MAAPEQGRSLLRRLQAHTLRFDIVSRQSGHWKMMSRSDAATPRYSLRSRTPGTNDDDFPRVKLRSYSSYSGTRRLRSITRAKGTIVWE